MSVMSNEALRKNSIHPGNQPSPVPGVTLSQWLTKARYMEEELQKLYLKAPTLTKKQETLILIRKLQVNIADQLKKFP